MASSEEVCVRRSERTVRLKRSYSPELPTSKNKSTGKNSVKKSQKISRGDDSDISGSGGKSFCNRCKSPFVLNAVRKLQKRSRCLIAKQLCNACGISLAQHRKPRREKSVSNALEKEKYLQEAQTFANSLVEVLHDCDAERLFCPEFKSAPCACLQKFVLGNGNVEDSQKRALLLLQLLKEAKRLSRQKCYSLEQTQACNGKGHKSRNIGLGNGQKRSQAFEMFVLEERRYLRDELHLCERATQRVLMYSNNFLHKKLKTEPQRGSRVERKKGKSALGLLKPLAEMATETCCADNCVLMALTHGTLLRRWRERAASGQAEARRVLAEMLTPCGGGKTNCYKFISIVTGCSHSTISKVNEQISKTGGEREPPEHGLKKWWQEQAKRNVLPCVPSAKKQSGLHLSNDPDSSDTICNIPLSTEVDENTVELQLRSRDCQLTELQSQVMALQQKESLLDDPMFTLNSNSQVVLKLNGGSSRLRNLLRQRKISSLLTDDEMLQYSNGSETQLSTNLFLSSTALLASDSNSRGAENPTSANNYQAISHLVLDDVTAENLLSSGTVINIMQSSKGAEGRQSTMMDDMGLLRDSGSNESSQGFLSSVLYVQKQSPKVPTI